MLSNNGIFSRRAGRITIPRWLLSFFSLALRVYALRVYNVLLDVVDKKWLKL